MSKFTKFRNLQQYTNFALTEHQIRWTPTAKRDADSGATCAPLTILLPFNCVEIPYST